MRDPLPMDRIARLGELWVREPAGESWHNADPWCHHTLCGMLLTPDWPADVREPPVRCRRCQRIRLGIDAPSIPPPPAAVATAEAEPIPWRQTVPYVAPEAAAIPWQWVCVGGFLGAACTLILHGLRALP